MKRKRENWWRFLKLRRWYRASSVMTLNFSLGKSTCFVIARLKWSQHSKNSFMHSMLRVHSGVEDVRFGVSISQPNKFSVVSMFIMYVILHLLGLNWPPTSQILWVWSACVLYMIIWFFQPISESLVGGKLFCCQILSLA